jgi:hypothetical protein
MKMISYALVCMYEMLHSRQNYKQSSLNGWISLLYFIRVYLLGASYVQRILDVFHGYGGSLGLTSNKMSLFRGIAGKWNKYPFRETCRGHVFLGLYYDGFLLIFFSFLRSNVLITKMIYDIFYSVTIRKIVRFQIMKCHECLLVLIALIPRFEAGLEVPVPLQNKSHRTEILQSLILFNNFVV